MYQKGDEAEGKKQTESEWTDWAAMFSERGYTSLEVDITASKSSPTELAVGYKTGDSDASGTPPEVLREMTALLASQIRLLAIPFPPIIVSEGHGAWLAQSYVGDNPASGLVMVSPAPDGTAAEKGPTFGYEPHFPILVMGAEGEMANLQASRLGKASEQGTGRGGKGVTVEEIRGSWTSDKNRLVSAVPSRWPIRS